MQRSAVKFIAVQFNTVMCSAVQSSSIDGVFLLLSIIGILGYFVLVLLLPHVKRSYGIPYAGFFQKKVAKEYKTLNIKKAQY